MNTDETTGNEFSSPFDTAGQLPPEIVANPYSTYRHLHERGPIHYYKLDGYPVDSGSPNILWFGDFLGFCNRVNNHLVSRRIHGYRLLDEPIEEFASAFGVAAVETEGELVQV